MKTTVFPDPARLTGDQLRGWACALCGARLYRDRSLGLVPDPYTSEYVELWACAPRCSGRRAR
ncbi:hypothetical protein [Streptomyces sp. KL116D]|uniref:hypothetical protein n=1 Tax=Streptomyces sp. KL116D TaxID=3045152 RepID=UPI00355636F2